MPEDDADKPAISQVREYLGNALTCVRGALCSVAHVVDYKAAISQQDVPQELGPGIEAMRHLSEALKAIEQFDALMS